MYDISSVTILQTTLSKRKSESEREEKCLLQRHTGKRGGGESETEYIGGRKCALVKGVLYCVTEPQLWVSCNCGYLGIQISYSKKYFVIISESVKYIEENMGTLLLQNRDLKIVFNNLMPLSKLLKQN